MTGARVRIVAISAWMFIGGPLVWGAWMVWRLKLLRIEEFLGQILPIGLLVMLAFLALSLLNLRRQKYQNSNPGTRHQAPVQTHCLILAGFGTLGTATFMIAPDLLAGDPQVCRDLLGALAGFSLIGLFYPVFSIGLFSALPGFAATGPVLRRFNTASFGLGLAAYFTVAVLSELSWEASTLVGLAFPLLMSGLLFTKAWRRSHVATA